MVCILYGLQMIVTKKGAYHIVGWISPSFNRYDAKNVLQLRTSSYKSLTSFVCSVLVEVLDEALSQVFCFLVPL